MRAEAWSVYIARCADGSLYTGVAKDVRARLAAHNAGRGAAYTRPRRPVRLVHREDGLTRGQALSREASIKALGRPAKLALLRAARLALAAVALLLAAARARAVPVFNPEGVAVFGNAAPQSFVSVSPAVYPAYPQRMYFLRTVISTEVGSATSPDGVNWLEDNLPGRVSTGTVPLINVSSITGSSVMFGGGAAPLLNGYAMMYSAFSDVTNHFGIYRATSADGLAWANTPSAGLPIVAAGGVAYLGSPSVVKLAGGSWRMYYTQNTDGGTDLGNRRIFTTQSFDQGQTWSAPTLVALSTISYEVGASVRTDGLVRLFYSSPIPGFTQATVIGSLLATDLNGVNFVTETGPLISNPGTLAFPVPTRSTDTFRWRLYYQTPAVFGSVFSALTGPPAPVSCVPVSALNTAAAQVLTINGEIFSTPPALLPTFFLTMAGQPNIIPTGVAEGASPDLTLTGTVNLVGAADGIWSLTVVNADGNSTTLTPCLTVTFPAGSVSMIGSLISPRSGNATTTITVNTFNPGNIAARIFTIDGRRVTTLFDAGAPAGSLVLTWNGTNAAGQPVASGTYVLHVVAQKLETKQKIVVIR